MKKITFKIVSLLLIPFLFVACDENSNNNGGDDSGEKDELKAYITEVFDYMYAPGQHAVTVEKSHAEKFIGKPFNDVYLGGFGGYIIAGFEHNIENIAGEYDFEVYSAGVSPEPAVVYVMSDENGDGLPNDTWYELKGSLYGDTSVIQNYSVTYYKPLDEDSNVTWQDNQGNEGELIEGKSKGKSSASWWWSEAEGNSITFTGVRLPDAYVNRPTEEMPEHYIVPQDLFQWGYAENNYGTDYDKKTRGNRFDIGNAVDKDGQPVNLPHIRFIKVQSAVFQQAGWLNEVSSEVQGAKDLHY